MLPIPVRSLAVHLPYGVANVTEGQSAVHLLDGAAKAVAVSLEAARRAVPTQRAVLLSTSWTGRLT